MVNSPIDEIKNRLDIVEVVQKYIKLKKAGVNYTALCPFHSEKTPSFFVSPTRQIWHCFGGCSEGGDIFKFVMKIEGVEFSDALRILAKRAGVELKKQDPKLKTERQRLYEICELATKFFEEQLKQSKIGQEVRRYLLNRKINEESLKKWRIGYAPDTWQGLSDFLTSKKYSQKEIKKAGLGLSSERGSFYDRFRGRIIFPIFDLSSNVVGFTGRVFKNKDKNETGDETNVSSSRFADAHAHVAKYVNTPQSLLYDKGRILYGLNRAKIEIRKKNTCILVEGNTDLIMVHQAGFENAVAVSGTALTAYQLNILKRYSDNLLIAFDMDSAGQAATKRGIDLAQAQGFNIKIITLTEGKDPAEIISKDPEEWKKSLEGAKAILDFYFDSAFFGRDIKNPEVKKEIAKILLPVIKRIPNKIEQAHWVQKLAEKLGVKEDAVQEQLKNTKAKEIEIESTYVKKEKNSNLLPKSRKDILEETVAFLILKNPKNLNLIDKNSFSYFSSRFQTIFTDFKKGRLPKDINFSFFAEDFFEEKDIDCETEIKICLKEIRRLETKNKLDEISGEIKKAEQACDLKKVNNLTKEFNKLSKGLESYAEEDSVFT